MYILNPHNVYICFTRTKFMVTTKTLIEILETKRADASDSFRVTAKPIGEFPDHIRIEFDLQIAKLSIGNARYVLPRSKIYLETEDELLARRNKLLSLYPGQVPRMSFYQF